MPNCERYFFLEPTIRFAEQDINHKSKAIWLNLNTLVRVAASIAVFFAVIFFCFYNLGTGTILGLKTTVDESIHIRVIQDMRASGDWWSPTFEGMPYYRKPPLKMWLSFLPISLFGESYFSYRLLDAVFGMVYIGLAYFAGMRMFQSSFVGIVSALTLLGCYTLFFSHGIRNATQDMAMLLFSTWMLLGSWIVLEKSPEYLSTKSQVLWGVLLGSLLGLGAMSKSVAAFYPFFVLGIYCLLFGRLKWVLTNRLTLVLTTFFLAVFIPALYYIPHFLLTEGAFGEAIQYEIVNRFSRGFHNKNDTWFYFRLLRNGDYLPAIPVLCSVCFATYQTVKKRSRNYGFLLIWLLFPLICYTYLKSKMSWYVAPAFFPMAVLIAAMIVAAFTKCWVTFNCIATSKKTNLLNLATLLFCTALLVYMPISIGHAIYKIGHKIAKPVPHMPIALAAQDMLKALRQNPGKKILSYEFPEVATMERLHFNMLKPHIVKIENAEELSTELNTGDYLFLLSSPDAVSANLLPKFTAYKTLPPNLGNQGWKGIPREVTAAIVSFKHNLDLSSFRSVRNLISLGKAHENLLYGFSEPHRAAKLFVRSFPDTGAALLIEGDDLMRTFGTKIYINMARIGTQGLRKAVVHLSVNGKNIYSFTGMDWSLKTYELEIPSGVWQEGRNHFGFNVENPPGVPLSRSNTFMVNWISVWLSQSK